MPLQITTPPGPHQLLKRNLRVWVLAGAIAKNSKLHHEVTNHSVLIQDNNRFIYVLTFLASFWILSAQHILLTGWSWLIVCDITHMLSYYTQMMYYMPSSWSYPKHTQTHWSPSWEKRWRRACTETFQPRDLITIPNQWWEDECCCVPSAAHPQLKEMMCMNRRVVGWAAASPITPLPSQHHCMHTFSWEIVGSAYCQGVLGHRPVGHLTWWESSPPSKDTTPPSYTWEGKQDLRMALRLILCGPFPYHFFYLSLWRLHPLPFFSFFCSGDQ